MNWKYVNDLLNTILCRLKTLETQLAAKKLAIAEDGEEKTDDATYINFTGNVVVTADDGEIEVNIPDSGGGGDCDACLEFDADRTITRDVLGLLGENLGTQGVIDTLEELLYPYLAPSIVLTSPSNVVLEKSSDDYDFTYTATSTKNTDDITQLEFLLDGVTVYTESSVNPDGQVMTTSGSISRTDGTTITPYILPINAWVNDGTTAVTSNTRTITLVYPYFYGVGTAALNAAGILALTKAVVISGDKTYIYSPNNQKIYIAYPTAYGGLSEINDGALNVTGAFTLRTDSLTMADGEIVGYNIYESNNLLTISGYTLNFIQ